jgi:hypothetical protein
VKLTHVILTLIPFIWCIGAVPWVNKTKPIVMGLPFLAFWEVCGIFVAFFCIGIMYKLDYKEGEEDH